MDHVIEAAVPEKYNHIDFKPPEGVRKAAERGLEMRREFGRGGTAVGVARARDLSNGKTISPSTARRMKAYFDRHQPDQKAEGFRAGEDGYPSAGRVAWEIWGGDAGYSWAKKLVKQMNSADEKGKVKASNCGCAESCDCGCQAPGGGQPPADMTISNLKQIVRDASELLALLHEDMELMGWAEDKVSQAKVAIDSVRNYVLNDFPAKQEAPVVLTMAAKKPWEEKRKPEGKLSKHWRNEAEKRAKEAGRKYPNQVDNMWAAKQQNMKASVAAALRAAADVLARSENVWYHTTSPERLSSIMQNGLKVNQSFNYSQASASYLKDVYGMVPVFLSKSQKAYDDDSDAVLLAVDVSGLKLAADIPTLADKGAYIEGDHLWFEEERAPASLPDEVGFEDLMPGGAYADAAIKLTGTATVLNDIAPSRISVVRSSADLLAGQSK